MDTKKEVLDIYDAKEVQAKEKVEKPKPIEAPMKAYESIKTNGGEK